MTDNKDDFDAAFEEVALAAEKGEAAPVKTEEPAKSAEQIAADAKAAEDAARAAADAKAAEEAAAAAAAANAGKSAEQIAAEAKAAEDAKAAAEAKAAEDAKLAAGEAARAAAEAKAAQEAAATKAAEEKAAQEAALAEYVPNDAEKTALEKFKKDFPEEYVAIEARLKGTKQEIARAVHDAVEKMRGEVAPRLSAVETAAISSATERHFATLRAAHADYDTVIPKVAAWIKTRPAYLQPALQQVYEQGTTEDVLALVTDYKAATAATDPAAAAAAEAAAKVAAKAKADADAAGLEPVGTRRSTPVPKGGADKNNFDGAWEELSAAAK